jgi:hypothetical protein
VTFVHERKDGSAGVSRPALPCLGDEIEGRIVEVAEGPPVLETVNDDLLALEGRVEVRDDAYAPARRPVAQAECLRRRAVLTAGIERAALELVLDLPRRPRPSRSGRRVGDPAPG